MKISTYLIAALSISLVAPLSINAYKPTIVDHYERTSLEVQERHEGKSYKKLTIPEPVCPLPWILKKASKGYGIYYLVSFYTTLAHEYGHALSAKLLFEVNSTISLFPTLVGVEGFAAYHGEIPAKGLKTAAVVAAGPIFGVATGYGILKLYNILSEYFDKSKSIKNAIKDGLKKPLLNADHGLNIQIAVGLTSFINLCNLIPIIEDNCVTDGAYILYALK